jgi:hypothetical protein
MDSEYHQAMIERERELAEALERIESGNFTADDIDLIRYECGQPRKNYGSYSEIHKNQ